MRFDGSGRESLERHGRELGRSMARGAAVVLGHVRERLGALETACRDLADRLG